MKIACCSSSDQPVEMRMYIIDGSLPHVRRNALASIHRHAADVTPLFNAQVYRHRFERTERPWQPNEKMVWGFYSRWVGRPTFARGRFAMLIIWHPFLQGQQPG
jgi:hypothetical protein